MGEPEAERRERLAETFDQVADAYASARPGYPDGVFSLLVKRCGLGSSSRVLEIGAGAGQATIPMLHLGAHVTAVEPGAALARKLTERAAGPRLAIVASRFEEADIEPGRFDIVAAATSFHWIDPSVRFEKAARALRAGGWLATWSNVYGDSERPDPFHEAVQPALRRLSPELLDLELPGRHPSTWDLEPGPAVSSFEEGTEETIRWEGSHGPAELRALFSTFSSWIALQPEQRERVLDEVERIAREDFSGRVVRPYRTVVRLWRRVS